MSQSNSLVLGNNANVGIGTSTPAFKLEVTDEASFHGVKVGRGGGALIENTAVGLLVLNQNNNGIGNTGTGYHALRNNFNGSNNTATGFNALSNNGSGSNNTAAGFESLMQNNGIENTAVGYHALFSNDLSDGNTAIGSEALNDNTLGNNNTALGINVLNSNIDGDENTAIGNSALGNNIGGNNNTAIGSGANVAGGFYTNATAIGAGAIVSQSNSLVLGNSADVGIGTSSPTAKLEVVGDVKASSTITSSALSTPGIVTNNSNGLLGTTTAVPVSNGGTGTSSIFTSGSVIFAGAGGVYSEDAALFFDQSNIRLGIGLTTPLEKLHVIGNGLFTGNVSAFKGSFTNDIAALNGTFLGNVTASCGVLVCSDVRYKKSITPLSGSLEKLSLLNGVNYYFKKDKFPELNFNDDKQIGLIAQEVENIFPELVKTDVKGYKSVDYAKLTPVLVEAIKELKAANDLLKTDIEKIKVHLGLEAKAEK